MTPQTKQFVLETIDYLRDGNIINDNLIRQIQMIDYESCNDMNDRKLLWQLFEASFRNESEPLNAKCTAATIATNLMLPKLKNLFNDRVIPREKTLSFEDFPSFYNECWMAILDNLPMFDVNSYGSRFAQFITPPLEHVALDFDREKESRTYYIEKKYKVNSNSYEYMQEANSSELGKAQEDYIAASPEDLYISKKSNRITNIVFKACQMDVSQDTFDNDLTKKNAQLFTVCHKFLGHVEQPFKEKAILKIAMETDNNLSSDHLNEYDFN